MIKDNNMTVNQEIEKGPTHMTANSIIKAIGFAYDPVTNAWTKRVEYNARDKMEAIHWCNFNRDWMKNLQIVEINQGT